ncbi:MAG: hypothetical protein ABI723_07210 [Bacteroidia bacterium]
MKIKFGILSLSLLLLSCNSAHEKINQVSEKVGQAGGEVIKSVSTGVEKAFDIKVELSEILKSQGINLGKVTVSNDSAGTDNKVSVYIIFTNDFNGTVTMKAFDNKNLEMGRVKINLDMKKDDAKFVDFRFDSRTNIDTDSKLTIE